MTRQGGVESRFKEGEFAGRNRIHALPVCFYAVDSMTEFRKTKRSGKPYESQTENGNYHFRTPSSDSLIKVRKRRIPSSTRILGA